MLKIPCHCPGDQSDDWTQGEVSWEAGAEILRQHIGANGNDWSIAPGRRIWLANTNALRSLASRFA
ncbi:MAG: hypothetical protein WCS94_20370 [Verrucomicrobiota bacterium]